MNKKQLSNVLGAGMITGFVLALILLFNGGDAPIASSGVTEVVPMENYNQLQAQNDQLIQDLQMMQNREQQYEAQITTANELIAQQSVNYGDEDHDEEHDEHEEDEHEYESDDD
ncbi:MAG: hypothetical protein GY796_15635 [Chloroflexi bacterium]|nr:hypothetical protein [Chloroflexota bacterium]